MQFLITDDKPQIPFYELDIQTNLVIARIDGTEIFRAKFSPKNFIEKFRIFFVPRAPPEHIYKLVRWNLEQRKLEKSEAEVEDEARRLDQEITKIVADAKVRNIAECMSNGLHGLVAAILDDAIKAYAIYGMVELFEQAGEKPPVEELKKNIIKTYWSRIAKIAGIKRGGYKGPKGFWDDEKKKLFCISVDELPRVNGERIWKYIFDELAFVDFDLETQAWLKQRRELQIIPEDLFDEAVSKWRKFNSVREITDNDHKPRFFEYRLALNILGYPDDYEFNTLDTYYKHGKKLLKRDFGTSE